VGFWVFGFLGFLILCFVRLFLFLLLFCLRLDGNSLHCRAVARFRLSDESNGIGDAFLYNGSGAGEIGSQDEMERYMKETKGEQTGCGATDDSGLLYNNKEALILEWVRYVESSCRDNEHD
jgi:hypothetical protein